MAKKILQPGEKRGHGVTIKHGHNSKGKPSKTYVSWQGMKTICQNPNSTRYKFYGGKGIKVCPQWESFEPFLADMGSRSDGQTLQRLDLDGDFTPENCFWGKSRSGNRKHGHCHRGKWSRSYWSWVAMRGRCNDPSHVGYKRYGGRGIKVCPEWDSFSQFLQDMGERPQGKSLDRIDVNGPYCRKNCRWATAKEQANNTSRNRFLTYNGQTKTVTQWADSLGIKGGTLEGRLKNGWSTEKALTTPVRKSKVS